MAIHQYRIINVGKGILNITKDNLHETIHCPFNSLCSKNCNCKKRFYEIKYNEIIKMVNI